MTDNTFTCVRCGKTKPVQTSGGTGYAITSDSGWRGLPANSTVCYDCCAKLDRADMQDTGRAVLYDCGKTVTNWPGTLSFDVYRAFKGNHNWATTRHDVYFTGPDGNPWWGVRYGDNTQILHCRRIKSSRNVYV